MSSKPSSPTTPNYGSIPITTTTTTSTPTSVDTFITRTTHSLITLHRPWRQLLSPTFLSFPTSYSSATSRLRHNLTYFRFNYSLIILTILFLSLIYHPISLLVFLLVFLLWLLLFFLRDRPLVLFGRIVDDRFVILGLTFVTVIALVGTNVGTNVLVSLALGFGIVGLHAALRTDDDLFFDNDDGFDVGVRGGGFLPPSSEAQPLRAAYATV